MQCDNNSYCWCVDSITGKEYYGSKEKFVDIAFDVCASLSVDQLDKY